MLHPSLWPYMVLYDENKTQNVIFSSNNTQSCSLLLKATAIKTAELQAGESSLPLCSFDKINTKQKHNLHSLTPLLNTNLSSLVIPLFHMQI